jgi:hypothetical protein
MRLAALPLDVRKASGLPTSVVGSCWALPGLGA